MNMKTSNRIQSLRAEAGRPRESSVSDKHYFITYLSYTTATPLERSSIGWKIEESREFEDRHLHDAGHNGDV